MNKLIDILPYLYRSPLEAKLHQAFLQLGLNPKVNEPLHGYEIDFLFKEKKLCIEVDGAEFHSSAEAIKRDDKRQKNLEKKGYTFHRMDGWFVYKQPLVAAAEIVIKYFAKEVSISTYKEALALIGHYLIDYDIDLESGRRMLIEARKLPLDNTSVRMR